MKETIATNHTKVNLIGPMDLNGEVDTNLFTLFIDGGLKHFNKLTPKLYDSLGDNDSLISGLKPNHLFPSEKDESDLRIALKALDSSVKEVLLFGFWGGRSDHFFINVGEIIDFLSKREARVNLFGDNGLILFNAKGDFKFKHTGIFSILSLDHQQVEIQGAKYSGEYNLSKLTSQGLSNEAQGEVMIKHSNPIGVFIFSNHKE